MERTTKEPTTVGIRELKQRLSYYFHKAELGRPLRVTRRGKVVLMVSAPPRRGRQIDPELDRRLDELEQEGFLTRGNGKPLGAIRPIKIKGGPMSDTVIEERRASW